MYQSNRQLYRENQQLKAQLESEHKQLFWGCLAMLAFILFAFFYIQHLVSQSFDDGYKMGSEHAEMGICSDMGASDWEECSDLIQIIGH